MNELLLYYKRLEAIPQEAIERYDAFIKENHYEEECNELKGSTDAEDVRWFEYMDLLYQCAAIDLLALFPIYQMWSIHARYNSLDELISALDDPTSLPNTKFYRADEIYEIVVGCSPAYAKYIVGRMSPNSSVFEQLLDSIETGDKQRFISLVRENECDIKSVAGIIHRLYFMISEEASKELDELAKEGGIQMIFEYEKSFMKDVDHDSEFYKSYDKFTQWAGKLDGLNFDDASAEECISYYQELFRRRKDYVKNYYYLFDFDLLTKREKNVLETIKSRPEVSDYFKAWDEEYQQRSMKEGKENESKGRGHSEHEPLKAERTNSGRPKDFWIDNAPIPTSEEQAKKMIEKDVWSTLEYPLGEMMFPKTIHNKEAAKKAFGAAIIVYSASQVGLCLKKIDKYTPSMERTLGSSRSTVNDYLKMLNEWYPNLRNYYHGGKLKMPIERLMSKWKLRDSPRASILADNFHWIDVTINNVSHLLENIFHIQSPQYRIKEWPEKRDRTLDRASTLIEDYKKDGYEDEQSE